jgi:hypothetical protein
MFIVCVSFVNLCFLNVWVEMNNRITDTFRRYGDSWVKLSALNLDILILAALLWGVTYLALWTGKSSWIRFLKWAAFIGLLAVADIIRHRDILLSGRLDALSNAGGLRIVILLAGIVAAVIVLVKWERICTRLTTILLILLAPALPLSFATAAWHIWSGPSDGLYPNKPLQPALPQSPGAPHVLWILFDEWDEDLTFRERPPGLSLPELDRFQDQAFHANRAYTPSWLTQVSVPSLLAGKILINTYPDSWNELKLVYDRGRTPVGLSKQETIFSEARRSGFNVGIAGWYLPYCRLIPECTVCTWHPAIGPLDRKEYEQPYRQLSFMAEIMKRQIDVIPLLKRLGIDDLDRSETPEAKALHAISYGEIHDDMLRAITDPRLNLVFVHVNVPHPPPIYDLSRDAVSHDRNSSYLGNLRLVDRTLGDIRKALEQAGMWDTSTILLTGDHPLRVLSFEMPQRYPSRLGIKQHHEVPYLLRMPGETRSVIYDSAMNTIVTKDLLMAILNQQVATPEQIATWVDRHPPHLQ